MIDGKAAWRTARWLTVTWAAALACICVAQVHTWLQDDGLITLRYARHLSEGRGPVWNLTGAPVEGFSSPLHVLLAAALMWLKVGPIIAVRFLGFASHAGLVVFVWRFVRKKSGEMAGILAAGLVLASWPLLLWDLGGLDAVPFGVLAAIGTLRTLQYIDTGSRRDVGVGGFFLGLAVFMRPDGALLVVIALGACLLLGREKFSQRVVDVLLGAALCVVVAAPWEIFRVHYFHEWLPNTYYAKMFGVPLAWRIHSGLGYWRTYLFKAPYFLPLLSIVVLVLLLKRRFSRFDAGLWMCIVGYGLYLVECGGDHMPGFRFMVPLIPFFAVALVRGLQRLGLLERPFVAAAVSLVLMIATARQMTVQTLNLRSGDTSATVGPNVGRYIDAHWKPGSVVALNTAGSIPYFADRLTYIDMLGLNDVVIAQRHPVPMDGPWVHLIGHLKGDGANVLKRRPDFIILGGVLGMPVGYTGPPFLGDYELIRQPGFAALYKGCKATVTLDDFSYSVVKDEIPKTTPLWYYQRRDLPDACIADPGPGG